MNKSLFLALIFSSFAINSAMLNSAIFMKKEVVEEASKILTPAIFMEKEAVEEVSKWSIEGIKNIILNSNISCESVKETTYNAIKNSTEPLRNFAYENMALAAGAAAVIAITAYQSGKYVNSVYYTPEEVKEIVNKKIDAPTRRYNPRAQ